MRTGGGRATITADPHGTFSTGKHAFDNEFSPLEYGIIDLYITSKKIYFSEFTFAPNNGREKFSPNEWDAVFGKNWSLNRE